MVHFKATLLTQEPGKYRKKKMDFDSFPLESYSFIKEKKSDGQKIAKKKMG